ncbi:MAG: ATP-binding protein [Kangiellaceae bacterium]|nr:ATP-binding protein [Kangiellaceae bacterium]MCW8999221.1 ATP-binding protein [Kangiellaceae bacterium]
MGEMIEDKNLESDSRVFESGQTYVNLPPFFYAPWLSIIASLIAIFLLVGVNDATLLEHYSILEALNSPTLSYKIIFVLGILYLLDIQLFQRNKRKIKRQFEQLNYQLELAWKQKAKQQARANTFSGQTDKLKGFISDKLLEFIEYDEKFVHFKGIASEVRHNGVISYDKVTTALKKAVEQQRFLSIYEQEEQSSNEEGKLSNQTLNALAQYQNALDAMEYLWALLDLSTADNMALHIGNQLIEREEHYFQLQLDAEKQMDITQSIPASPTFHPQLSLLLTLSLLSNDQEIRNLIALSRINHQVFEEAFDFSNEQFSVYAQATGELLGNHNHIILLLENLIKNAQFFSSKAPFKQSSDRVVICLENSTDADYINCSVYNRGPHINEDDLDKIFELGYSTRRNQKHHGKGLGLFFSKQIIDGYQGKVEVENVDSVSSQIELKIQLASGEIKKLAIESDFSENRPRARLDANLPFETEASYQSDIPFVSISNKDNNSSAFERHIREENPNQEWLIFNESHLPILRVVVKTTKRHSTLKIKPLDIKGVRFQINIPTAASLLEE